METASTARVQALAEASVPHLPAQYVQPPEHRPAISSSHRAAAVSVPVVDLSSASAADAVRAACADWGAFYVVGHGVPVELLDAVCGAGLAFFRSPMEDKLRFACDPARGAAAEGYGSRMLANDDTVLDWRDYFDHHTLPESRRNPSHWPDFVPGYR
jgi:isopenicillin N synthase-like dioxygenase